MDYDDNYAFNTETGEAKSSDIESDRTTKDERDSDEEWNPEVESWEDFKWRMDNQ